VVCVFIAGGFGITSTRHLVEPKGRNFLVVLGRGSNARRDLYTEKGWRYRNYSVFFQTLAFIVLVIFAFTL
jgi:hypothetical protein